jgi:hypothetical protein
MFCPQCGQQQVSDVTRFCSRCGFPLEGTTAVLASGGTAPLRYVQPGAKHLSPRSKGVRQGAVMMLSTILLVPVVAIISTFILGHPEVLVSLTAMGLFLGGLFRILYALIMEDSNPTINADQVSGYAPPQFSQPAHNAALPPPAANQAMNWRPRPNTAEIYQPPSVTENTTRLLDKDKPNS